MSKVAISFTIKDPTLQLDPATCACKAFGKETILRVVQQYSEKSCSAIDHLRIQFKDSPVLIKKPDGTLTTFIDLGLKNGDTLEISHRHGNACRFCKKTINIKLRAENGYACSFKVTKTNPLKNIISGFANFSLTSIENLTLSYQGKQFKLEKADGKLITAADLKMGDNDQIDIRHQR